MDEDEELTVEDSLIGLAEQPDLGASSWAASNTLVFSHLIPQRRFAEARLWCDDLIEREVGYESWNAISNLGIVEFESGHTTLALKLFEAIVEENRGPINEAKEYIDLIQSGVERPLDTRVSWEYSDDWRGVDVSQPLNGSETAKDIYDRVIKILDIKDMWEEMSESFDQSPAATIYGLASGIYNGFSGVDHGVDREVFVQACADYVFQVVGATRDALSMPAETAAQLKVPEAKFCTSCGTARSAGDKFCTSCGEKF